MSTLSELPYPLAYGLAYLGQLPYPKDQDDDDQDDQEFWHTQMRNQSNPRSKQGRARRIGLSPAEDSGTVGAVRTLRPRSLRGGVLASDAAEADSC